MGLRCVIPGVSCVGRPRTRERWRPIYSQHRRAIVSIAVPSTHLAAVCRLNLCRVAGHLDDLARQPDCLTAVLVEKSSVDAGCRQPNICSTYALVLVET